MSECGSEARSYHGGSIELSEHWSRPSAFQAKIQAHSKKSAHISTSSLFMEYWDFSWIIMPLNTQNLQLIVFHFHSNYFIYSFPCTTNPLTKDFTFSSTPAVPAFFFFSWFCITGLLRVTFPHTLFSPTEGGLGLANARTERLLWPQGRKLVQQ